VRIYLGIGRHRSPARLAPPTLTQTQPVPQTADVPALSRLLAEEATFEMPPIPTWFAGRDQVSRFLASVPLRQPGALTMVPVAANGQPGFACYLRGQAHAI
jgi:hypothetical protein